MKRIGSALAVVTAVMAWTLWAAEGEQRTGARVAVPRPAATGSSFRIRVSIEHGHIGEVYFGCDPRATDAFDRGLDDLAPPPGIGGVGYTFLVPPDRKYNLYKDVRAPADTVQWVFYGKVGDQPVELVWDAGALPAGWDLYFGLWDGKSKAVANPQDGRRNTRVTMTKTGFCRFWISRNASASGGPPDPGK